MILEPLQDEHHIAGLLAEHANRQRTSASARSRAAELAAALRRNDMSAVVALEAGEVLGIVGWKVAPPKGTISLLAVSDSIVESQQLAGVAGALTRYAREAAEAKGARRVVHILQQASSEGFESAFREAGFQGLRMERWVRALADHVPALPPPPAGFTILPWRPRYTRQVVELFLAIPRDPLDALLWADYDSQEGASELVDSLTMPLPVVPPALTYVAMDEGGTMAGYALARVTRRGSGWIGEVGVRPEHQRKGLGRALVANSLQAMVEHHLPCAELTVLASNAPAIGLYRSLGLSCQEVQCAYVWLAPEALVRELY